MTTTTIEIAHFEQSYLDKVFERLYNLKQGEEIDVTVDKNGKESSAKKIDKFIKAVELYIYCGFDHFYGYVIEMNQSKTKVRKHGIWN